MTSFEPVKAVLRALDVLRLLNEEGPLTTSMLAGRANLPQPTVIRLLETLMAAGYVYKDPETNVYGVTARTLELSRGFDANSRLVQIAKPLIEELRARIGWPSSLAVYVEADNGMSIAYTNREAYGMSMPGRLGARLPLLVTSVGGAFLSNLPPQERDAILARLKGSHSQWDSDPEYWGKLDTKIATVQANGYALAEEKYLEVVYDSRIWSVAVPVIVEGRVAAALSTQIIRHAGQPRRLLTQVLPALTQTAADIGSRLMADAVGTEAVARRSLPDPA
ncbi:helix-turn-helix domain-containing protein [Azospirillum doebereinerae]